MLSEIQATSKNIDTFKRKYGNIDDDSIKKIFDRFNSQQSRLKIRDIFGYESLDALRNGIDTKSKGEVEKQIKTSEANIIINNEDMMIVEPLTRDASLKYGANTKWCTTYTDPEENRFNEYFDKVSLVYFIDKKNNTKYAIAYSDKVNEMEAFDERDKKIDPDEVLNIFGVSKEDVFSKTVSGEEREKWIKISYKEKYKKIAEEIKGRIEGNKIEGSVNISELRISNIKEIFDFSGYVVRGDFDCHDNQLTSLEGAPKSVGGDFYCSYNKLTSLEGAPKSVGGDFYCGDNQLTTLEGAPQSVGGDFICYNNQLTTLEGAPQSVGGDFYCNNNPVKFSDEDIKAAMEKSKEMNSIKEIKSIHRYKDFYINNPEMLNEGHCIMVDVPNRNKILEFVNSLPNEHVYIEEGQHYGKETNPHITLMYGLDDKEEARVKELLNKIPKNISATLGKISKFENADTPYDVLKIEVHSPHLHKIHEMIRNNFENNYKWPNYNPHLTLAYVKKGTCNEYVGGKIFEGMKFKFENFTYSNGNREQNHKVNMKEYFVGQSGGYGGGAMTGGAVAPTNWAGTFSSNQTSRRLNDYPASRRYTYMQGNTVIGSSLYDTITQDDLKNPKFSAQEIFTGLRKEMGRMEYPDKDVAKKTVLANLEKNPKFYSDLQMYFDSDKQGNNIMENIDPKEIEMGTKHEHEHTKDDALARKIAMDHLKEDPHYYTKLKAAGLEEGALTPLEAGMTECGDMDNIGAVSPIAPAVALVKLAAPAIGSAITGAIVGGNGQEKLSSSNLASGTPKPLKSDKLEAPAEKAKVGANKVVVGKTPSLSGNADPLDHFGSQMTEKW